MPSPVMSALDQQLLECLSISAVAMLFHDTILWDVHR